MKRIIISLALLAICLQVNADITPRIIGGTSANPGDSPYTVALLKREIAEQHTPVAEANYKAQYCGGSLIAPDWVLTAAHCLDPAIGAPYRPEDILVLEGTHTLASGGTRRPVHRILRHFSYESGDINNDLALLKLGEPATAATIDLLTTPAPLGSDPGNPNATVSGWGDMDNGTDRDFPYVLQVVDVPVISQSDCEDAYNNPLLPDFLQIDITSKMLCAGYADVEKDSCQGDSGGPLVVLNPGNPGNNVQIGVVSFGEGCAAEDSYGVYTRLSVFADWVNDFKNGTRTLEQAPRIVSGTGTFHISPFSPLNDRVTKIIVADSNHSRFDFDIIDGNDLTFRINSSGEIKVQGLLLPGKKYELYVSVSDNNDSMTVGKVTIKADDLDGGAFGLWFLFGIFLLGPGRKLIANVSI